MRVAVAVLLGMCVGCGTSADDLRSKSWTELPRRPGKLPSGYFFDDQGRLLTPNVDNHIYRFDLDTRVWSDFGEGPGPASLAPLPVGRELYGVYGDTSRATAVYVKLVASDPPTWETVIEVPDGTASRQLVFSTEGIWRQNTVAGGGADWYRLVDGAWSLVASNIFATVTTDAQGHPFAKIGLDDSGAGTWGQVDGNLQPTRTLFQCDGIMLTALCQNAVGDLFSRTNGEVVWQSANDIMGSTMYRSSSPDAQPVAFAPLPTMHDNDTYNHSVNLAYDGAGNAYVTRTNNNYGTESLFMLPAGSDTWEYINDTPGFVDLVLVREDGTLFVSDGGFGSTPFYVLE
jgi:hypothetical protein